MNRLSGIIKAARNRLELVEFGLVQTFILIVYVLKMTIDPLNLGDESDRITADFYNVAVAPFYGSLSPPAQPTHEIRLGQQEIVVVLIDEHTMQGRTWPVEIPFYRVLLDSIANFDAAAVFLDIYFQPGVPERDEQVAGLFNWTSELEKSADMPVFFASRLDDPVPQYAGVSASHYALAEINANAQSYRFRDATDQGLKETAAYSMYRTWCHDECASFIDGSSLDQEMYVRWGAGPDSVNVATFTDLQSCQIRAGGSRHESAATPQNPGSFLKQLRDSATLLYSRLITMNQPLQNPSSCVYHRTLSAVNVVFSEDPEQLREWLEGKIVLVGTDLALFRDITLSPVHGYIPGIYKIAMALDNMMEMGDSYLRWVSDDTGDTIEVVLLVCVLSLYVFFKVWSYGIIDPATVDRVDVLFSAGVLVGLTLVVMFTFQFNHFGPNAWVGFLLMSALVCWPSISALFRLCYARLCLPYSRSEYWNIGTAVLLSVATVGTLLLVTGVLVIAPLLLLADFDSGNRYALAFFYMLHAGALIALIVHMRKLKNNGNLQLSFHY